MKTIEPIAPAESMPDPEWIRVKKAMEWSSIGESGIYALIRSKRIKSTTLRERGEARGTRLISFPSLKAFLNSKATGGEEFELPKPPPPTDPKPQQWASGEVSPLIG